MIRFEYLPTGKIGVATLRLMGAAKLIDDDERFDKLRRMAFPDPEQPKTESRISGESLYEAVKARLDADPKAKEDAKKALRGLNLSAAFMTIREVALKYQIHCAPTSANILVLLHDIHKKAEQYQKVREDNPKVADALWDLVNILRMYITDEQLLEFMNENADLIFRK